MSHTAIERATNVSWGSGAAGDESYWERVRARFPLDPDMVYLNSAALGVPPDPVIAAVHEGYLRLSQDPDAGKIDYRRYNDEVAIPELAALMGARPEELAINRNASVGLALVADGATGLRAGDEILTTSHEHPVGVEPWRARAARDGLVVREVELPSPVEDAAQLIEPLRAAITGRTRVLAFCHVTRGGIRYPIEAMCRLGREHGLIIAVDGAQAIGRVPVDVTAYDCDLYAASLHKWLLAPSGTGVLYVRQEFQERFGTITTPPGPTASRYEEEGTFDLPTRAGIGVAVAWLRQIGMGAVEARNHLLAERLRAGLAEIPGMDIVNSPKREFVAPGTTLVVPPGGDAAGWRARLQQGYNLRVDDHVRDGHDALRISTHYFVSPAQVDRLIAAMAAEAA